MNLTTSTLISSWSNLSKIHKLKLNFLIYSKKLKTFLVKSILTWQSFISSMVLSCLTKFKIQWTFLTPMQFLKLQLKISKTMIQLIKINKINNKVAPIKKKYKKIKTIPKTSTKNNNKTNKIPMVFFTKMKMYK